ncbi:uncharacterized protein LOC131231138 isoform X1 [Magnolia sinica]|uniref:uncharacterized protein LOC131231138 isoform X1 n=1 Tax=Magnolia sinica TaxID=86752 RepID=UPI0026594023|nr:uncharacterized protein LOC131231138 isoform X1 [Magnolia sinica]
MEKIQHRHVEIRGLKHHVAEIGTGSVAVVFLHGFPEIWYSWRHQMIAVADAGFRAIAPDCRGYGLSEQPPEPEKASFVDLVEDIVALLDLFGIPKVFIVAADFGVVTSSLFAVLHPERLLGFITLGVAFFIPGLQEVPQDLVPEGFYISRWQEPGRAEADFGRFDVKTVVRNIYILFSRSEVPVARKDQEIMDLVDPSTPLPPWFTEDDLTVYATLYEKSGFRYPLQVPYRTLKVKLDIKDPKTLAPALLIMGEKDIVLKFPGMEDFIKRGKVKENVPNLEMTFIPEGSHFIQEQFPEKVNKLIISFLNKHSTAGK